jgi:hypothetical protein
LKVSKKGERNKNSGIWDDRTTHSKTKKGAMRKKEQRNERNIGGRKERNKQRIKRGTVTEVAGKKRQKNGLWQ